ncbi:MAG: TetR/AcrR family transcriptional regulator [Clostridia bacterium]|jgi:TetR/AcrR family transcriptional repressor of lmrAB and yxaGH operons|nr:TetR/AcrR family transcriptional regulator [Clostridia bacterium]MCI1999678.1 TetR/AcrR family transcriptional regulator [Clostridia bacterium]MCI2013943.1 TetR/AcrR family transcriptional regulator [Clostridia bacterium]
MKSAKGLQAKQHLIETASKLFLKNGYSNTGINEILKEANMSKGSFYFYFSSKKELGLEVANYYGKSLLSNWLEPLSNYKWDIFVNKLVHDIKSSVSAGNYFGCPIAVLGLETAFTEDKLSEAYAAAITKLINIFSKSLQVSGLEKEKADILARKAFAIYEGHVLYYRICKDISSFDCIKNDLLLLVNN